MKLMLSVEAVFKFSEEVEKSWETFSGLEKEHSLRKSEEYVKNLLMQEMSDEYGTAEITVVYKEL